VQASLGSTPNPYPGPSDSHADGRPIVIAERDPAAFMAAFARGAAGRSLVFLADPEWRAAERAQADALVAAAPRARRAAGDRGWLMIPSGGTGGRLKFARHDADTIAAAVDGFCRHFAVTRVDAVGVLPLYHVSGFMAWMRCALTAGTYRPWRWPDLAAGSWPARGAPAAGGGDPAEAAGSEFISLVPTQLQRLIAGPLGSPSPSGGVDAAERLRCFRAVCLGGGPLWPSLIETAARLRLPLSIGYGMTETAAMVAAQCAGEFLAGDRSCGRALPHARIDLTDDGRIRLAGASLFRGYFPEERGPSELVTEDVGEVQSDGRLTVLGRRDAVIITGGKKVDPLEVEAALRATEEFADLAVVGLPDPEWGHAVTVCYPAGSRPPDLDRAAAALAGLAPYKHPKRYCAVSPWPRNPQGKVNRLELVRLAALP
jgi:O-succinylbenzoic acid--CoA ligase